MNMRSKFHQLREERKCSELAWSFVASLAQCQSPLTVRDIFDMLDVRSSDDGDTFFQHLSQHRVPLRMTATAARKIRANEIAPGTPFLLQLQSHGRIGSRGLRATLGFAFQHCGNPIEHGCGARLRFTTGKVPLIFWKLALARSIANYIGQIARAYSNLTVQDRFRDELYMNKPVLTRKYREQETR